eukprot:TRINITY_DN6080_c2_g1_i2.p1 TRINITY_DN6080_c2_g1~~TRINITY_DN6080_c2_g1_i2.p1  ORF type:complete len:495 (-),score=53.54 TRINITY_DN6080_c2_g1_i2:9-1493(-)
MVKKLRYFARFIVVALLLNRLKVVKDLVGALTRHVNEYLVLKPEDAPDWQAAIQEITLFLQAENALLLRTKTPRRSKITTSSRRTNWSIFGETNTPEPESNASLRKSTSKFPVQDKKSSLKKLQSAILVSNHAKQVKFSELTLDTFRMILTLEPVSSDFDTNMSSASPSLQQSHNGKPLQIKVPKIESTNNRVKKYLLYRPTVSQLLTHIASAQKELTDNGVLMLYFSADGYVEPRSIHQSKKEKTKHPPYSRGGLEMASPPKPNSSDLTPQIYNNSACFYPEDLLPFTRHPMFIIVDSENSTAFLKIPNTFGVPFTVLCSPVAQPDTELIPEQASSGSLFSFFLHSPLDAFCLAVHKTELFSDVYEQCQDIVQNLFKEMHSVILANTETPHVMVQFLEDPILRLLILRFVFCHAVLSSHTKFQGGSKYLPSCHPKLPSSLLQHPSLMKTISVLAKTLEVTHLINIKDNNNNSTVQSSNPTPTTVETTAVSDNS